MNVQCPLIALSVTASLHRKVILTETHEKTQQVARVQPNIIDPPDDIPNKFLYNCVIEIEERDEINRCVQQSDQIGWGVSQIQNVSDENSAVRNSGPSVQ